MCGIVGFFTKNPEFESRLGEHLSSMLIEMSDRGPDSAGVAIYRDPAPKESVARSSGTSTCLGVSPPRRTLSELAMTSTATPPR